MTARGARGMPGAAVPRGGADGRGAALGGGGGGMAAAVSGSVARQPAVAAATRAEPPAGADARARGGGRRRARPGAACAGSRTGGLRLLDDGDGDAIEIDVAPGGWEIVPAPRSARASRPAAAGGSGGGARPEWARSACCACSAAAAPSSTRTRARARAARACVAANRASLGCGAARPAEVRVAGAAVEHAWDAASGLVTVELGDGEKQVVELAW